MAMGGLVIVGAGQAGFQAAVSARMSGYEDAITLIGSEPHLPYQRPPLSKGYLLGKLEELGLALQRPDFYLSRNIRVLSDTKALAIDRSRREVVLASGVVLPYAFLILATGARSRKLGIKGEACDEVHYLRGLDDARALRYELDRVEASVVVGGGFIGLEFAAVARARGIDVTLLEAGDRLMERSASPIVSRYIHDLHVRNGVRVLTGAKVEEIVGAGSRACNVVGQNFASITAEMVLVGTGAEPNTELAQACGLSGRGAIQTDGQLRTADNRIFAIGDCAAYYHQGRYLRLESVQNAVQQGKHVARVICGDDAPYFAVPWFWSDQYGEKLQIAGLVQDADERVVRGDMHSGKFSVFSFLKGELQGVESINSPADHVLARRILLSPRLLAPREVAESSVNLKGLVDERMRVLDVSVD